MKKIFILVVASYFLFSCSQDSEPQVEADVISPSLTFSIAGFPSSDASGEIIVLSNSIEIDINATDEGGISKIEAFINGEKVGEDTRAPYKIVIDVSSYASKMATSNKYKNYSLKVVATDNSENITSKEQQINIDNELPAITEVALQENAVIAGTTNAVSFSVTDNQEISGVNVYVNNKIINEIRDKNYEVNIDTSTLLDGENTLKIEASDSGGNIATHQVPFIVDNTGPEITIESIMDEQIVDNPILLDPTISDNHSTVLNVEYFLGDRSLTLFEDTNEFKLNFDPLNFSAGLNNIIIKATDKLGNESRLEIPIEIYRRLITINFPSNFYDPQNARIFVFASSSDGKILDNQRVFRDTEKIILRTSSDIGIDDEFMLTFAEYMTGQYGNASEFTTLQNLKPSTLNIINLRTYPRFQSSIEDSKIPTENFELDDLIGMNVEGYGYGGSFYSDTNEFVLQRRRSSTSNVNTDYIYIPQFNHTLNEYSYFVSNWEVPSDFILTPNIFSQQGVETRFFKPIISNGNQFERANIRLYGYFNEEDFNDNVYHKIYGVGSQYNPTGGIPYYFNNIFEKYRYKIIVNDYYTERTGEPLVSFETLDWTIDHSFSNNTINLIKSGLGHAVGNAILYDTRIISGLNISCRWKLIFDSQKSEKIILPEIPQEIQSWGFYPIYEEESLAVQQVEIKRYSGISSYDDYLDKIIKDSRLAYLVSPIIESKFKTYPDNYSYYYVPHFFLFD